MIDNHSKWQLYKFSGKLSLEEFIRTVKVREGTYAHRIALQLYNVLFQNSIDLKQEYQEVFSDEYSGFEEFLLKRYAIKIDSCEDNEVLFLLSPKGFILTDSEYGDDLLETLVRNLGVVK